MGSKLLILLLISSCFTIAMCQTKEAEAPPCMKSLMPCKPYLQGKEVPTPDCCVPLNKMMKTDMKCLCNIFTSPEILAGLNVTREEAIKLPTNCDEKADLSECEENGASTPSSAPGGSSSSSSGGSAGTGAESPAKMDNNGGEKMMIGGLGLVGVLSLMMMMMF